MTALSTSYVCGVSDQPLRYETVGECLDNTVARFPDREALVVRHQNIRWTYTELQRQVNALAAGFIALGLMPGDRIGIWSPNNAEWVVTQFASAKAGLILVNINPAYRLDELRYSLNKVGCKALLTMDHFKSSHYLEMLTTLAPELHVCEPGQLASATLPFLRTVINLGSLPHPGIFQYEQVATMAQPVHFQRLFEIGSELKPDEPINIQFTSGTTGFPKGATLTHFNIVNNGFFVGEAMNLTEVDRLCVPVPLYHCFGMVMANLGSVTHGATLVYPAEAFEPLSVLETVQTERCTALYGVPTMFIAELDHPQFGDFDLSTLRTGIMAGSPCPIEVMKLVVGEMHMRHVTICYGMTETSPVSFQSSVDDTLEKRVSTVGRIHPHVQSKIVDGEGQTVSIGETGELLTRGYSVMRGYWDDEELTRESIDEAGWMHTGDLATFDEEGYCNIVGRLKDMVIRGGENVYPREVEEFLYRHPKIQDVQCFGVPDERYGEELCAWVKVRPGMALELQEVREFCDGQIAHYKVPRYVKVVESFPMTVTGKIQKFLMREAMIKELDLKEQTTA